MVQPDLRLERQGDALIVHAKHSGRWVGVLAGVFGLYLIWRIYGIEIANQGVPALVAYWFGFMIGVTSAGIGVFLLLPREVAKAGSRPTSAADLASGMRGRSSEGLTAPSCSGRGIFPARAAGVGREEALFRRLAQ